MFIGFLIFFLYASISIAADYRALHVCLGAYPGGYTAAQADPAAAATWANELQGATAEEIPTSSVWAEIMDNRDVDWRPGSGTTSGGKTITDGDREDVRLSVIGGGRDTIPVSPGSWGRELLIGVFGGSSTTITELQEQFTVYQRRCADFGGQIDAEDVTAAIDQYGS